MAGRFVSIEEAARLLGVGVDEVKRLVERKKLFPLHDGNFKIDEIERVRASLGDESSQSGSLSLDLDMPGGGGDDLALDISSPAIGGGSGDPGSQTIVRGGGGDGLSGLALDDDDLATDGGDLVLEANPGASSPSLARPAAVPGSVIGSSAGGDPLTLDISDISVGSAAGGIPGSQLTGGPIGGLSGASAAGSGFATPADSGLSLEEPAGLDVSGIELATGAAPSGVDVAGGSLLGDEFNLGENVGDEDSASVVIATEESGDSSFFTNVADDSASVALDSSVDLGSSSMSDLSAGEPATEAAIDMQFSGWQIAGLTCCALLLLIGGIVMYDLLSEIHKPQGDPFSGLLLNAMGQLMGWRR